ncbi:hypothetical protein SUGI_0001500 [Cryptomeria japonica]|nr:hypothetical protein SUGI_0001500 [Cryptomeria japonica]
MVCADERIAREGDLDFLCNVSATSMYSRAANGDGYLNDGVKFTGNPAVGFNYLMQSTGGCQVYGRKKENHSVCMADRIMGSNKAASATMRDIKALRELNPQAMCALNGILLCTLKKSESYLGPTDDLLTFEISYPRSREAFTPTWNMDFYQEIEQMLIEKYGGSLHWGKSGGHLFEGLAAKTVDLQSEKVEVFKGKTSIVPQMKATFASQEDCGRKLMFVGSSFENSLNHTQSSYF